MPVQDQPGSTQQNPILKKKRKESRKMIDRNINL